MDLNTVNCSLIFSNDVHSRMEHNAEVDNDEHVERNDEHVQSS